MSPEGLTSYQPESETTTVADNILERESSTRSYSEIAESTLKSADITDATVSLNQDRENTLNVELVTPITDNRIIEVGKHLKERLGEHGHRYSIEFRNNNRTIFIP